MTRREAPLLVDALPEFAERVARLLREQGNDDLAGQLPALGIVGACACGREFCGSFYTANRPTRRWFRRGKQVAVEGNLPGEVILDVIDGEIVFVEVLFWGDVREAVARLAPPARTR